MVLGGLAVFSLIVVVILCVIWARHEYKKQVRIGEELDKERAELEKQLLEEEQKRVQLAKAKVEANTYLREQGYKPSIQIKKDEPIEVVYPLPRARAVQTMKPSPAPTPRRTSSSVSSTPKTTAKSNTSTSTSRSTSRRDDDDSTVYGSSWGSYSSSNDDSSWGSSSSSSSCGSSSSSWGSDSSSSSSSSDSGSSWCD
ncbi:hypothetical protein Blue_049 [Bacillus phage Deep Blue]|uniref:Uncharacterized protein n=1 Tax=Bacillus phage Deep Blue TaxID=1792245 RepID=A0A140HLL0_9CAUD|nr:hypothetical protein Blue_049 [Bacillus phage Deep Blue]AMO25872.1 hypothetical protein Blue_049 [Bacillus phage Deep Blue]